MSAGADFSASSDTSVKVRNLSVSSQFVGTGAGIGAGGVDVRDVIGIRMGVLSTQDGLLTTEHLNDSGVILRTSFQPVNANVGEFLSFHPRASQFRWTFDNTSPDDATVTVETHFSYVPFTPTQSLVSATLARTSLATQTRSMAYDYKYDSHASIIPSSRDLLVTNRNSLIADDFTAASLDTSLWTTTATGSGAAAIVAQELELTTGVTANSTVRLNTSNPARFIAGNISAFKIGVELPNNGVANNKRRWGAYNDTDGWFFELDGTTLYAVGRANSVDTRVAAASWSNDNTFELETTQNVHSFEVSYFGSQAWFIVDDEVVHIQVGGGRKGSFPIRFENNNSGGSTTDVKLTLRGAIAQRYGPTQNSPRYRRIAGAATTTLKIGPGNLHRIIVANGSGANTATVYDNTAGSGTIISLLNVNKLQGSVDYLTDFHTGLTIVTIGADTDLTVVFD